MSNYVHTKEDTDGWPAADTGDELFDELRALETDRHLRCLRRARPRDFKVIRDRFAWRLYVDALVLAAALRALADLAAERPSRSACADGGRLDVRGYGQANFGTPGRSTPYGGTLMPKQKNTPKPDAVAAATSSAN